jgi:RimJ/RimL family protein N-acetyltransferase
MTALDIEETCQAEPCHDEQDGSIPELRTERLVLRAPCRQDAKAVAHLINDRRIAENTARIPHPYTLVDAYAFLAQANRDPRERAFLITLADGTIVGGCGLQTLGGRNPEPGYWIGVPYWGRGYATEAARALVDYAFTQLGHERLSCRARVSNPASRRVLEKCGFEWTSVSLIRIHALKSSTPADCFLLDRARWAALKRALPSPPLAPAVPLPGSPGREPEGGRGVS